jgi:flagellar motor component MotA
MLGSLGTVIRLVGFLALFLSIVGFVLHGNSAPLLFLILGIVLIVGGSYAKYVSRHSMRVTK